MRPWLILVGSVLSFYWLEVVIAVLPWGRPAAAALAPSLAVLAGTRLPLRQGVAVAVILGLLHDVARGSFVGLGPGTLVPVCLLAAVLGRRIRSDHVLGPVALGATGLLVQHGLAFAFLTMTGLIVDPLARLGIHMMAAGLVTLGLQRPFTAWARLLVGPPAEEAAHL